MRQFGVPVQHKRQCIGKDGWTGAGLYGFRREMPPKRSRTRNSAEKSKYVTCNGMQPNATGQLALDIGHQRDHSVFQRVKRRGSTKNHGVHIEQLPWLLIRRPAHHHAVQRTKLSSCLIERRDAPVEYDFEVRMRRFEAMDKRVVKRRHFAISRGDNPFSQAFRACTIRASTPASFTIRVNAKSASSGF